MRVIKPFALGVLSRSIEVQRKFFLGIAATTFCPMGGTPGIAGDIAMWKFLAETLPPTEPLDLVLPKPQAEFLVSGDAFTPGGRPLRAVQISARLGPANKSLMVVGDRHLEDGRPTDPLPFTRMATGWDRAYGGAKVTENPLGRGTEEKPLQGIGFRVPLPNVVSADRAAAGRAPSPVGFGAIDIAGGRVNSFKEKPKGDGAMINGGFFVLSPQVLRHVANDATVWEQEPLNRLAEEGQLMAYEHSGFWQPMDTLRDKQLLEALWAQGKAPWKMWQ